MPSVAKESIYSHDTWGMWAPVTVLKKDSSKKRRGSATSRGLRLSAASAPQP
jgi:hypothetical protein